MAGGVGLGRQVRNHRYSCRLAQVCVSVNSHRAAEQVADCHPLWALQVGRYGMQVYNSEGSDS